MAIQTRCPKCDASYNLAEAQRGKKVQCRKCSTAFVVGGEAAKKAPAPGPAAAAKSGKIRKDALSASPTPPQPTPPPKLKAPPVHRDLDDEDDYEDDRDGRDDRDDRDEPEEKAGMSGGIKVLIGVCVLLVIVLGLGATAFGIWLWMRNSGNGIPTPPVAGSGDPNAPNGGQQGGNLVVAAPEEPPKNVTDAIVWINTANTADRKNKAAEWLALATVDPQQRKTVADLMEKLALDPATHSSAIKALAQWAGDENVPTLLTAVESDPIWFPGQGGGEAAAALVRLQADGAADAFAAHLTSPIVHADAKKLLAGLGRDKAEAAVLRYMDSNNKDARSDALDLLRQFGTKPEAMFAQAVKDLRVKEMGYSRNAADYIGQQPVDPARQVEVAKALEVALGAGDVESRAAAAKALSAWATTANVQALIDELDHKDMGFFNNGGTFQPCLDALVRLQDPAGAEAIAKHLKDFGDGRTKAYNALRAMGKVAEKAVVVYSNDPDPDVASYAKKLIKEYGSGGDVVLDATLADLTAQDGKQRRAACDALAKMAVVPERQKDVARALEKVLDDKDEFFNAVPQAAVKALAVWGDKDTGQALAAAIQRPNAKAWQEIVDVMVQRKDEAAVVPLLLSLQDFGHKEAAKKALNDLGPVVETALDNIVADPKAALPSRVKAVQLLADPAIGTSKSVPVLQNAVMDPSLKAVATQVLALVKKRP